MAKVLAFVSFVLILLALVCCTVAFASYWYKTESDGATAYLKYNEFKYESKYTTTTVTPTSDMKKSGKNFFAILNASLAFDILAWIVLIVAAVITLLSGLGILEKIPIIGSILPMIGKFVLVVAVLFCLLSMLIFLGLKKAEQRDCKDKFDSDTLKDQFCNNDNGAYDFVKSGDNYYQGPTTSWIAIVIASALTIGACILNICGGVF
ncbi:hypothetical protein RB653_001254 [Dictyostelium firmibasis]|uniref:Transmembrane protein n=1 Tax=Dictyostelium firmibasis TaxID=79012 RepID=A0AAN7YRB9_9MYCE